MFRRSAAAAADGELGRLWFTAAPALEAVEQWVDTRLAVQTPDTGLTFVVRRLDGALVGSSSYMNVDAPNRRLEIGNTWYVESARRSGVNSETKLLMLGHAFDRLGCVAVEFRTHFFNFTSRSGYREAGREARRDPAQSPGPARRLAARHRRLLDPGHRVAVRAEQPALSAKPSRVTRDLLNQLHPRLQGQFGVDVREVGLHGARRDEQACSDVLVAQTLTDEPDDFPFGRGE